MITGKGLACIFTSGISKTPIELKKNYTKNQFKDKNSWQSKISQNKRKYDWKIP
jgi:hypothetical protein